MTNWEYFRDTLAGDTKHALTEELNQMGKHGWELVFYQPAPPEVHGYYTTEKAFVVMKRPLEPQILD